LQAFCGSDRTRTRDLRRDGGEGPRCLRIDWCEPRGDTCENLRLERGRLRLRPTRAVGEVEGGVYVEERKRTGEGGEATAAVLTKRSLQNLLSHVLQRGLRELGRGGALT
jgi:hypothetical protein